LKIPSAISIQPLDMSIGPLIGALLSGRHAVPELSLCAGYGPRAAAIAIEWPASAGIGIIIGVLGRGCAGAGGGFAACFGGISIPGIRIVCASTLAAADREIADPNSSEKCFTQSPLLRLHPRRRAGDAAGSRLSNCSSCRCRDCSGSPCLTHNRSWFCDLLPFSFPFSFFPLLNGERITI
jgi:hypothetical protein